MNISPIFYQGCKRRLINNGLIGYFPNEIDTFYDLFSGSGIISMNVNAKRYVLNDLNPKLSDFYNAYRDNSAEKIIEHIKGRVEEFGLPKILTKNDGKYSKEELERIREPYKKNYEKFRDFYNNGDRNILDLITLMYFSFSQIFRFNRDGVFNMPFGDDCFNKLNEEYIKNGCKFFSNSNVKCLQGSFMDIDRESIAINDFVYLDPPYFNSTAVYNESNRLGGGWTMEDEYNLFELCEYLNSRGISFGISNVFKIKGKDNSHLEEWCGKNKWNVYHFDLKYSSCGKGNAQNDEVYITNFRKKSKMESMLG